MQQDIYELFLNRKLLNPHSFLGLKTLDESKQIIRVWKPKSTQCHLEILGNKVEARRVHDLGLYEYELQKKIHPIDYKICHENGKALHDPYAFDQGIGELDIHLVTRGLHYELYNLLGATPQIYHGVLGIHFAVWAPNSSLVSILGEFNSWDPTWHPMRLIEGTGIWEIFMPGLQEGDCYQYEIITQKGEKKIKSDPVAHYFEMRPNYSSRIFDVDRFVWNDDLWIKQRKKFQKGDTPLNIYELHLGSWKVNQGNFHNYRDLALQLAKYCKKMNYTHVELMGICEHPLDQSWGYQVTGYFAPTSRFGSPEDFQYFVNYLHEKEIGVILDWVPGHFPTDQHSLAEFDGTYLYEHKDPRQGFHPHWSTHIFNYGRYEVSNFLIASAVFWTQKMHIDGLRVDAVASMLYLDYGRKPGDWIPNQYGTNLNLEAIEFLKHMNSIIHQNSPDCLMIAEESTAFPSVTEEVQKDGLGFDYKWNLGWMNDTLEFFGSAYDQRKNLLSSLVHMKEFAFNEKFILPLSHDEVVHCKKSLYSKMPGNEEEKIADLRLLYSFLICFPGKKLLFMGGEFGQQNEWNVQEEVHWHLLEDPLHQKYHKMVCQLNSFYQENGALFEKDHQRDAFTIICSDQKNVILAYLRKGYEQTLLCLHHFYPSSILNYKIYLDQDRQIREVFNTDSPEWGGSGIMNPEIRVEDSYAYLNIAPLSTQIFSINA